MSLKTTYRARKYAGEVVLYIFLTFMALTMIFPFLWMISSSLKFDREILVYPIKLLPESTNSIKYNYSTIWKYIDFFRYYLNTAKLAITITLIQMLTCSVAAFSFARLKFPGRDILFVVYLATMMVPWHAIMIPQFIIIKTLHLYNTHWALILTQAFSAFGVFLMRQNMLTIPRELDESAKIDGCSVPQLYWSIILPLVVPALATLMIFTFKNAWNDYMAPMLYLQDKKLFTIQLGLSYFKTQYHMEYGLTMAATVCAVIPIIIVYIFGQKHIVEGVAHIGLKG
ncbi:MAG: carbohydrate ABC transporter permease [Bacteroidales bacterium]|nr:carbohydrate ABC transporter permease [Bacteroidales bacterium]